MHAPVELVTVPALGAEWKAEELHAMTKKGRKEDQAFSRREKWKRWTRDEYGCCGGWGTRRAIVWSLFGLIVLYVSSCGTGGRDYGLILISYSQHWHSIGLYDSSSTRHHIRWGCTIDKCYKLKQQSSVWNLPCQFHL